jgi:hypothetical protein
MEIELIIIENKFKVYIITIKICSTLGTYYYLNKYH